MPYARLEHLCASTAKERQSRARRLKAVAGEARELMDRHGLGDWDLRFNGARTQLGECRTRQKLVLLSRVHAVNGPPERTMDTILHEIVHALAGPDAGHGPAWKAVARRLGATASSCEPESGAARRRRANARANFRAGDTVFFVARGDMHMGTIVKMNPKRAKVRCGDAVWSVPYTRLNPDRGPDAERAKA